MSERTQDNSEGYRTFSVTIENHSNQHLFYDLEAEHFEHGRWESSIPRIIHANSDNTKIVVSSKSGAMIGVEGTVTWIGGSDLTRFVFKFHKPYGSGESSFSVTPNNDQYKTAVEGTMGGHHSTLTVKIIRMG